ncbi:MAG: hypothetical protein P1U87_22695 [Verrucomicrobiales bacterium]|nr:hypothetical protein [Verrucomicrobiales bacterium]
MAVFAALTFAFVGDVISQEKSKKKDPYTRESGEKGGEQAAPSPDSNIVLDLQFIEVSLDDVMQGEKENLADGEWRDFVDEKIKAGTARMANSIAMIARSGQRTKLVSNLELFIPSDRELLPFDTSGPDYPKAMRVRPVGMIFEVDVVLGADRTSLDLSYSLQLSRHLGETEGARVPSERLTETDVMTPSFWEQSIIAQSLFTIGEYRLLTKFEADRSDGAVKEKMLLVFLRSDLVDVTAVVPPEKMPEGAQLRLRSSAVEIDANAWHGWLTSSDLPALFGGGAWARVEEAMAKGGDGVAVLAAPKIIGRSGNRAKVSMGDKRDYTSAFDQPLEKGGKAIPKETSPRDLGAIWELDPVMSNNGRIDVNQRFEVASAHGHSVSYRALVDEVWQPSIQFPKFYSATYTGRSTLAPDANLLVAVGTPAAEEGSPDLSKKLLFFLHNDTFVEK